MRKALKRFVVGLIALLTIVVVGVVAFAILSGLAWAWENHTGHRILVGAVIVFVFVAVVWTLGGLWEEETTEKEETGKEQ